jgi:hypothetical protein
MARFDVHEMGRPRLVASQLGGLHGLRAGDVFGEANEKLVTRARELDVDHRLPFLCECPISAASRASLSRLRSTDRRVPTRGATSRSPAMRLARRRHSVQWGIRAMLSAFIGASRSLSSRGIGETFRSC